MPGTACGAAWGAWDKDWVPVCWAAMVFGSEARRSVRGRMAMRLAWREDRLVWSADRERRRSVWGFMLSSANRTDRPGNRLAFQSAGGILHHSAEVRATSVDPEWGGKLRGGRLFEPDLLGGWRSGPCTGFLEKSIYAMKGCRNELIRGFRLLPRLEPLQQSKQDDSQEIAWNYAH